MEVHLHTVEAEVCLALVLHAEVTLAPLLHQGCLAHHQPAAAIDSTTAGNVLVCVSRLCAIADSQELNGLEEEVENVVVESVADHGPRSCTP